MKVARYMGAGEVQILDEPVPECPIGGLLVKTEACGLCSGELMDWYMDRKIPHVLGHEVAGVVVESQDERFPVGARVFPHHHAPCLQCGQCQKGLFVHCPQWKRTKLIPGGMAEFFAVPAGNLNDTLEVGEMRAVDAALIEPLACVMKSISSGIGFQPMRPFGFQPKDPQPSEQALNSSVPLVEKEPSEIEKRRGAHLPHWSRAGATYAVTFRLADSVPAKVQEEWGADRIALEKLFASERISLANRFEYLRLHSERIDDFLDTGKGSCVLRETRCAEVVVSALKHFDGDRYELLAWCVMPNHVHVVFTPRGTWSTEKILHSWKSFTANKINNLLAESGPVWQAESYDHLVRDNQDLEHCIDYVLRNPEKANLRDWPWVGGVNNHDLEGHETHRLEADATSEGTLAHATTAVIGLGVMGLMHMLLLPGAAGFELNDDRVEWAAGLGLRAVNPRDLAVLEPEFDTIYVCPGAQAAFDMAIRIANPGATIVMFAPLPPDQQLMVPQEVYFKDIRIVHSYSCGPEETLAAKVAIDEGKVKAEQVVSNFIGIDQLPDAYAQMKRGEILKPMVVFGS